MITKQMTFCDHQPDFRLGGCSHILGVFIDFRRWPYHICTLQERTAHGMKWNIVMSHS